MLKSFAPLIGAAFLSIMAGGAYAAEPWETFTRPPSLPPAQMEGRVAHEGAQIWFAAFGAGPPVVLLHGAGGDSGDFGGQVPALVGSGHRVITIDSRGQGRSTHDAKPLTYELMESDVVAVMDALNIRKAAVVGWSDGAIISLIMAMRDPHRTTRIFAFSPNMDTTGIASDAFAKPIVAKAIQWSQEDYARLSPTPAAFGEMLAEISKMTETQPNYAARDLARIHGPAIAIVDGDHEELIKPEHTRYLARTIPGARLIILKGVSHFASLQDPDQFNRAMIAFLDAR
jgi:pimeloyl-ACP methyl ester carboxylesterase